MEIEKIQQEIFLQKILDVLGSRLNELIPQQEKLLEGALGRIMERHLGDASSVTSDEIIGAYELITEHVYPFEFASLHREI